MNFQEKEYWTNRYIKNETGWNIGFPSTPLRDYIDQLKNKALKILIPGAGNAYEAEYLYKLGFKNVYILDISDVTLKDFKKRNSDFPDNQLLHEDFFTHDSKYDLILEQTFFCSMTPTEKNRTNYAKKMHELLKPNGKFVGLWFNFPLNNDFNKRPFGGNKMLYLGYFSEYFKIITFENCYNSIPERSEK
ncbi:methyltransferase domain-containing protein [Winogradskyella litorisediminis]|uniref:Methyltransferase domain-containing protein n=1 Tax=Winogradskyella litorisediminis TaxID=1156618 RepID=A0ABW3N3V3_9FLAO